MSKIKNIHAREILDSRGNPTVEVEVELESGIKGTAAVPSGASTGAFEAVELRDNNKNRYGGAGVLKAVENANNIIAKKIKGMEAGDQEKIDEAMIRLDGREDKSNLGANAILGVSLAVCRAASEENNLPLYKYISESRKLKAKSYQMPIPMFNIINGGLHSDSGLSVQEFMIIPTGVEKFSGQLRAGSEIFHALKNILAKENYGTSVGDEGGFSSWLGGHLQALEFISRAIKEAGYLLGAQINLGLDAAANFFYQREEDQYLLKPEGAMLNREALINLYREIMDKYYVVSIEDGLQEEDWEGWKIMTERVGKKPLLQSVKRDILRENLVVGDDLLVTNVKRLQKAIAENACNGAIVKLNQIGTLTETIQFIKLAKANKIKIIISHRSGETTDDFISDLAVSCGADFIKTGSLSRGERICKYNRLLKIEEEVK